MLHLTKKREKKSPIRVRYNRVLLGNIKWRHKWLLRSYTCMNICRNLKKSTVHSRSLSSIGAFPRKLQLFFDFALVDARNDQKMLLFCQKVLRIFEDLWYFQGESCVSDLDRGFFIFFRKIWHIAKENPMHRIRISAFFVKSGIFPRKILWTRSAIFDTRVGKKNRIRWAL